MRKLTPILAWLALTICLSSCTTPSVKLVRPTLTVPDYPEMIDVVIVYDESRELYTMDEASLTGLEINVSRLRNHIDILNGYIEATQE